MEYQCRRAAKEYNEIWDWGEGSKLWLRRCTADDDMYKSLCSQLRITYVFVCIDLCNFRKHEEMGEELKVTKAGVRLAISS